MSKTILITGASSGIGKTTALLFQRNGWNVVATMRNPANAGDLAEMDNVLVTHLDVTDEASIEAAVAAGIDRFGRIDVLLNNAGYGAYGPLEATSAASIRRQFDTNVIGVLETIKAVAPHFRANRAGIIINLSSMGGKITFPLGALYHGSKFAVEGLSEALSFEMAAIGVTVKMIEPGQINTDFNGRSLDFSNDASMPEYQGVIQKLFAGFASVADQGSGPALVAEVIYGAATDGTDQLRYIAGDDAKAIIARRKAQEDPEFLQGIRDQYSL